MQQYDLGFTIIWTYYNFYIFNLISEVLFLRPGRVLNLEDFRPKIYGSMAMALIDTIPLPNKRNLTIFKNYRGILLTAIAAKIYNKLILTDSSRHWIQYYGETKMGSGMADQQHHKYEPYAESLKNTSERKILRSCRRLQEGIWFNQQSGYV